MGQMCVPDWPDSEGIRPSWLVCEGSPACNVSAGKHEATSGNTGGSDSAGGGGETCVGGEQCVGSCGCEGDVDVCDGSSSLRESLCV